jgi:hypothetical protein
MPLANRDRNCAVLYSTDAAFLGHYLHLGTLDGGEL